MAPRRSLDETRLLLLETGARMLVESGANVIVTQVSVIDVCREAGLTTAGSAYKIWPRQEDFRVDLLRHLVTHVIDNTSAIATMSAAFADDAHASDFTEFVRTAGRRNVEIYDTTNSYELYLSLWIAAKSDPELAASIDQADADWLHAFVGLYQAIGSYYGREFVPPYTAEDLAISLTALVEGFVIRGRVHPERVSRPVCRGTGRDGSGQEWHLFACAAQAIIEAFTRPIRTEPDPEC